MFYIFPKADVSLLERMLDCIAKFDTLKEAIQYAEYCKKINKKDFDVFKIEQSYSTNTLDELLDEQNNK